MEFRICFSSAKYENDIFSLSMASSEFFLHAFWLSKVHFHQSGPLKLVKTMLKYFHFYLVYLQYGIVIQTWATKRSVIAYDEMEDIIRKETVYEHR